MILYFSNSLSANAFATSVDTLPMLFNKSYSLNCRNASNFLDPPIGGSCREILGN